MTDLTIWKPIDTIPDDGRQVLIACRNKSICIAPATQMREPTRKEKLTLAQGGYWPDAGFIPTHWAELPEPPSEYRNNEEEK